LNESKQKISLFEKVVLILFKISELRQTAFSYAVLMKYC